MSPADTKNWSAIAKVLQRIQTLEKEISSLEADRVRLVKTSRVWWRSEKRKESMFATASLLASAIVMARRDLSDAKFQYEVLTKGRPEAEVNRAVEKLSEDVVRDAYSPAPLQVRSASEGADMLNLGSYGAGAGDRVHRVEVPMTFRLDPHRISVTDTLTGKEIRSERVERYPKKRGKRFTRKQREEVLDLYRRLSMPELRLHYGAAAKAMQERIYRNKTNNPNPKE